MHYLSNGVHICSFIEKPMVTPVGVLCVQNQEDCYVFVLAYVLC